MEMVSIPTLLQASLPSITWILDPIPKLEPSKARVSYSVYPFFLCTVVCLLLPQFYHLLHRLLDKGTATGLFCIRQLFMPMFSTESTGSISSITSNCVSGLPPCPPPTLTGLILESFHQWKSNFLWASYLLQKHKLDLY